MKRNQTGDIRSAAGGLTRRFPRAPYGNAEGTVHRGLELLELFAVERKPLTVGTVSSKLGYPQSSTSVLLRRLVELGYLRHDRVARTFHPTLRVTFLGMWLHRQILGESNLLEFMETLARRSGQVAMLAMQNGIYAQYVHIVAARTSRVGLKPGLLRSICRAAVGKVLLSTRSDDEIRRIVRHANAVELADYPSPVNVEELLREIAECRETGWAESFNSINPGASVIATRLPVGGPEMPLAIGIGVQSEELNELRPRIRDLIRETINHYFGRAGEDPRREAPVQDPDSLYAVSPPK